MARNEWQDLVSLTETSGMLSMDVLRQLVGSPTEQVVSVSQTAAAGSESASISDTINGLLQDPNKEVSQQMAALTGQLLSLGSSQQSQTSAVQDNTQAVTQNTTSKGSSGDSIGKQIGTVADSLFGGVLGLSPLVSGIVSLFKGNGSSTAASATPFTLPPPVEYQAGLMTSSGGQIAPVTFGEGGQPRPLVTSQTQQVTVQVSAMDSRSFLDHSDEIAMALKEALLNSNSVADVLSEL